MIRPLEKVTVLEFEGMGPGPLAGRMLADLGAAVTVITRAGNSPLAIEAPGVPTDSLRRSKQLLPLDLKAPDDLRVVKARLKSADALIEGFRPGVMERLGLGPVECAQINPRLVYGRVTGWGQDGPLALAAGHDLNFVALSGALTLGALAGTPPRIPPTVLGDAAGALTLALGIASGLLAADRTGKGCVVDSAIVDAVVCASGIALSARGAGALDGSEPSIFHDSPFYDVYRCGDGQYVSIAAIEPPFYALLLRKLGLEDVRVESQYDSASWPALKRRLAELFATQPRDYWCRLLEGTDACFAPVLTPEEAARHPHLRARNTFVCTEEGKLDSSSAPRIGPLHASSHELP
jgi:alpha-methylacyl-CoA racemase